MQDLPTIPVEERLTPASFESHEAGRAYFLYSASRDLMRIGFTRDLVTRVNQLHKNSGGEQFAVVGSFPATRSTVAQIKKAFKPWRKTNDWYEMSQELDTYAAQVRWVRGHSALYEDHLDEPVVSVRELDAVLAPYGLAKDPRILDVLQACGVFGFYRTERGHRKFPVREVSRLVLWLEEHFSLID